MPSQPPSRPSRPRRLGAQWPRGPRHRNAKKGAQLPLATPESARAWLRRCRSDDEIDRLLAAGELGIAIAIVMEALRPFRPWIVAPRGALKRPPASIDEAERKRLASRFGATDSSWPPSLDLPARFGETTLNFLEHYRCLFDEAVSLHTIFSNAPFARTLLHWKSKKQMFAAFVMVMAAGSHPNKKITGTDLAALAVLSGHAGVAATADEPDRTLELAKDWDQMARKAKTDVIPVLQHVGDTV